MIDDPERCYLAALRILQYRFNSETELRRKLRAKKYDPSAIDAAIVRLHDEKWLDDERFAGAFVRTRARKNIGAKRIRRELHAAGVAEELASRAVRENVDADEERDRLQDAAARRARLLIRRHGEEFLGSAEGRAKLASWLIARGYDDTLVWSVVPLACHPEPRRR